MTRAQHTVEKIGGTSMSDYEAVRDNIILGKRRKSDLYQRIFVVSAYGGVTNELLEHKKTGEPGFMPCSPTPTPTGPGATTSPS